MERKTDSTRGRKPDLPKGPEKKKTAIALPKKTWEAARLQAFEEGRTFQELVAEAIEDYLKRKTPKEDGVAAWYRLQNEKRQ